MQARVLTRHEDIRAMLVDPRFNHNRNRPGMPTSASARTWPRSNCASCSPVEDLPFKSDGQVYELPVTW